MKKTFVFLAGAALLAAVLSCNKNGAVVVSDQEALQEQIQFRAQWPAIVVDTKTTAVEQASFNSFKASASTGSGTEVEAWTSEDFSKSGDVFKGDKWWPKDNPSYHFYASNLPLTFTASGNTVAATNATDVVCAYLASPSFKETNTLSFAHIFARLGSVTVSATDGYTISNIDIKITPKTGGTYNLKSGFEQTDGTGWSSPTSGSPVSIANAAPGTKSNDIYLVPGRYILTASWTATKDDYTESFSEKTVEVDLVGGKINLISAQIKGNATQIAFSVSVTPWSDNAVNAGVFPVI